MKLQHLASFIKSANAGASLLTFDIGFDDEDIYRRVVASRGLDAALISRLYGVAVDDVQIHAYDPACTIKITIPRAGLSGGIDERDFDGVQQYPLLLDVELPVERRAIPDQDTMS